MNFKLCIFQSPTAVGPGFGPPRPGLPPSSQPGQMYGQQPPGPGGFQRMPGIYHYGSWAQV